MKLPEIIALLQRLSEEQVIISDKPLFLRVAKAKAALMVMNKRAVNRRAIFRHAADEMRDLLK